MADLGVAYFFKGVTGPKPLVEYARRLEDTGLSHLFVTESNNDAMTLLAGLALATERLTLGSGIVNIYARHPYQLANEAAVVEQLSGGRFILGLGTGHQEVNVDGWGLDMSRPLSRMADYLETVRRALDSDGGPLDIRTERYRITGPAVAWAPPRRVPIYLAALGPKMFELAGRAADGVILSMAPLPYIRRMRKLLDDTARAHGRNPEDIAVYAFVNTLLRSTRQEAVPLLHHSIRSYYRFPYYRYQMKVAGVELGPDGVSDAALDSLAIGGPPEYARERLDEYREAGVDVPILAPIGTLPRPAPVDPDLFATFDALASLA